MSRKRTLKWGETPFHHLSHDELLRTTERMYAAILSMNFALKMCDDGSDAGFWGTEGSGGTALEKARQIIKPIHTAYSDEDIYRSFFRYANDLLFDRSTYKIGFGWVVCDTCKVMVGETVQGDSYLNHKCSEIFDYKKCPGTFRPLTWGDLAPIKKEKP